MATIIAFCQKQHPEEITERDLDEVADYIEREYAIDPLRSFYSVAFTNTAWFSQPAFFKQPEKKLDYSNRLLRKARKRQNSSGEKCVFTGKPATGIAFSDKLPPGRAFRQHIPFLNGENIINFFPDGDSGLPVSGETILCLQAFPLGCAKCGGKLLAVHSDNTDIIFEFAKEFFSLNSRELLLAHQSNSTKMPSVPLSGKTLLINTLLKIDQRRRDEIGQNIPCSITAYHLSNSGQSNPLDTKNPPLEIYHIPLEITDFLSCLNRAENKDIKSEWDKIVQRSWWVSSKKTGKARDDKQNQTDEALKSRRNILYEDILNLPVGAKAFLRQYFLQIPIKRTDENDSRIQYFVKNESGLVSWKLVELFLRKVMSMEKERIQMMKVLGESLASYINQENDRRFFMAFYSEQNYGVFRNRLINTTLAHVKHGNAPLIKFDDYITIFEDGEELGRSDWKLARDLVLIRMIEELYRLGWIGKNPDIIPTTVDKEDTLKN